MAVTYGFYNALEHDRLYDAIQMSSIFDGIIQDGIFSTIGTSMIVTAPEDGMYVNVGPGRAWFNHTWTYNDTIYPIEAEEAEVVLDRIDAVVLEVNSAAEVRANRIYFIKGTPSSDPVKPTMIHNPEVNQYALAYVHIRAGQTTIFQQDIENVVGTDETPFVTGLLQQVSVERLLLQWDDEFHRYFANFKRVSEADLLTWFNARKDEYDAWFADMEREGAEDLETFDTWFQHMKDQLDEDAAGHLQAEIDELAEACEKGSVLTVTTDEPDLIGRTCTVSQGLNSINKQFDSNGVAEFPSVPYIGNDINIRATYGDNIAQTVITIPYFGRYGADIAFWAATLDFRTTVDTLYGRTITISKGGSVVGTTTFDNTGHAVYKVHETGTYHIYTSTAGGDVYEDDVVVTEETLYSIELGLPNGNTALPVNDIQLWLKCAGITDKAYLQTLEDVLNEPETYELLLSDSNACDYMARSTAWADAGIVPVMTSYTTPSGTVIYSSENTSSSRYAWKAFDRVKEYYSGAPDKWVATSATNQYIGYTFTSPTVVKRVYLLPDTDGSKSCAKDIKIEGSNDGSTWETLDTRTLEDQSAPTDIYFMIDNDTAYTSYRVYVSNMYSTTSGVSIALRCVQFYSDIDIPTDVEAMRILGKYDYACEALLSDNTWREAICNSAYVDYIMVDSVPVMTSDTAPSGEVFYSSKYSSYAGWRAFQRSSTGSTLTDGWIGGSYRNEYVGYDFVTPTIITKAYIKVPYSDSCLRLKNYRIEASNDKTEWTTLYTGVITNASSMRAVTVQFINTVPYRYYRLYGLDTYSSNTSYSVAVIRLQFYGRHGAQTDIIRSAASDTIYYMDNGSPVTLCTTDANGIGEVDWSTLPTGNITLYSSVAKNLSDLTADYSKTIKVTKNKVEAYLMPDKALYWYGWESPDLEDCSSANGWSRSSYSQTLPTHTTNYIDCEVNGTNKFSMVGIKNTLPNGTVLTAVCQGIKAPISEAGFIANYSSKTMSTSIGYVPISSLSFGITTYTMTAQGYGAFGNNVGSASYNREIKLYAFWYE